MIILPQGVFQALNQFEQFDRNQLIQGTLGIHLKAQLIYIPLTTCQQPLYISCFQKEFPALCTIYEYQQNILLLSPYIVCVDEGWVNNSGLSEITNLQ